LVFTSFPPVRQPAVFPPSCNPGVTTPIVMLRIHNLKSAYFNSNKNEYNLFVNFIYILCILFVKNYLFIIYNFHKIIKTALFTNKSVQRKELVRADKIHQTGTIEQVSDGKRMKFIGLKSGSHSGFHSGRGWKILLRGGKDDGATHQDY
jgi:hypothetical protein